MNRIYSNHPLHLSQDSNLKSSKLNNKKQTSTFKDLFNNKVEDRTDLKLSKHAKKRLQARSIDFTKDEINKLETAIDKAKSKGAKESLVLINNNAYIVSVNNNTVITAMDKDSMQENLFTNIDSAIVMK